MNNEGSSFLRRSTSPSVSLLLPTGCRHHCPGQHQHHLLRATLSVTRAILSFQHLPLRTILSFCSPQPRRNREGNHLSDFISHCCWEPAIGRVRRNTGRWWYWKKKNTSAWELSRCHVLFLWIPRASRVCEWMLHPHPNVLRGGVARP